MITLDPDSPLSPSEVVLLRCDQFASKAKWESDGLLHLEIKYFPGLAQAMLTTAFLANEQVGALRLEVRQKKARLGLGQAQVLFAEPVGTSGWPAHSPEAELCAIAAQLKANTGNNEVANVVYAWLKVDFMYPAMVVVEAVKSGLAERGLLQVINKQVKMFLVRKVNAHGHVLLPATAALAAQQPVATIQQLLAETERDRPEVWRSLVDGIMEALRRRTKD